MFLIRHMQVAPSHSIPDETFDLRFLGYDRNSLLQFVELTGPRVETDNLRRDDLARDGPERFSEVIT